MPVVINGSTGISGVDGSAGTPAFQGSDANTGIRFGTDIVSLVTGGSDRLYIDSSGKLGVGTSSPAQSWTGGASQVLQLQGPAATITVLRINESGGTYGDLQLVSSGSAEVGVYNFSNGAMRFGTNGTERLRIDSSGRVGIGTTTPGYPLQVDTTGTGTAAGDNTSIYIQSQASGRDCNIRFGDSVNASARIGYLSNNLYFYVNGNERARIDSSGRLLVGTSSARTGFQVSTGFGNVTPVHQFEYTSQLYNGLSITHNAGNNGYPAVLALAKSRGSGTGSYTAVVNDDGLGWLDFYGADGTNMVRAATIRAEVDGTPGTNDMPGRLTFSVTRDGASSPTEAARITNQGAFWNYSAETALVIGTAYASSTSNVAIIMRYGASGVNTGTNAFIVRSNGQVENVNGVYGTFSDIKLKENIVEAGSQWNDLKNLRVVNYNYKEETGYDQHTQLGVIAQEIEVVSPGLVSESVDLDEDGNELGTVTKSVKYSVLYMKAVKALQEAMERIEALEAKVAALEAA